MIPEWKLEETSIKVLELLDDFHFFIICRNYIVTHFYYFSTFKIIIANLNRNPLDF